MPESLRVLVIGGYGEFGGRLSELLLRDGHHVIVAGRQLQKAEQFCHRLGGVALQLDINTDLALISNLNVSVVVDAAGPFQSYGDNEHRYRVAHAALQSGAHYLDLSDDGHFIQGIGALDDFAKKHKRFALSGASSTPALSGAAVHAMRKRFSTLEKIETSILPGSRAPQGYSVMQAILAQVGNPVKFWRNNAWVECNGWSEPATKSVGMRICRRANLIIAADVVLFPDHFKPRSVLFRAGLAVPIMHNSLQLLGHFRSRGWLPNLITLIKPLRWMANLITPFGNDQGGMLVEITGHKDNQQNSYEDKLIKGTWTLTAGQRQGPYVPTIVVRTILQNLHSIEPGARACIDELPLTRYVEAMQDINVITETEVEPFEYLFQTALGDDWLTMPEPWRETHKVIDRKLLSGIAKITRGSSLQSRFIAWIFRFPAARENIPVTVTKTRIGNKEVWQRDFDGQQFYSTLQMVDAGNCAMVQEQFGLLKFVLQLPIIDKAMHMNVLRGSCLGIPIPSFLLPISNTREYVENGRMHFSVELLGPLNTGLIVHYQGSLE